MITCPLFYLLNTLRATTLLALACCAAGLFACVVIGLRDNRLSFFVTANILVLWMMSLFLAIVEVDLFRSYWGKRWPCFGPRASLVTSGICQLAIAFQIFGALSGPMSKSIVGIHFNNFNLAAAIIATIVGSMNILISVVCRRKYRNVPIKDIRLMGLYLARRNFDLSIIDIHSNNRKCNRMASMRASTPDLRRQGPQEGCDLGHDEMTEFPERFCNGQIDVEPSMYSIPTYYRTVKSTHVQHPEPAKLQPESKRWGGMFSTTFGGCIRR